MSVTVQPATARDVAHLHQWKWTQDPDGIYGLWGDGEHPTACVHLFDIDVLPANGGSPIPVCGMGGIATDARFHGRGHATTLLKEVIREHSVFPDAVEGFLLNGRDAPCLWQNLGFANIGPCHTRPGQRLWWLPARPHVLLPHSFVLRPTEFHF